MFQRYIKMQKRQRLKAYRFILRRVNFCFSWTFGMREKNTLLRMMAGLEEISSGDLIINERVANDLEPKDRNLSMVFQNYALYPHLSVEENILFGLKVRKVQKEERQKRLMEAIEMVGLKEYVKMKPGQLSGGQRQRVALARAIVSQAPICLMDEPLSNLMRNYVRK